MLGHLWALPVTLPALVLALLHRSLGARVCWMDGAIEVSGPSVLRMLALLNMRCAETAIFAITFGHVIFVCDDVTARRWHTHERIHVRQYQRWGLLFPFAYAASSLIAVYRGGDIYRDNAFEREAFRLENPEALP